MSHISHLKTIIRSREHLLKALSDLGYRVEEGKFHIPGFGGQQAAVEIRVPLRLSNDIGFHYNGEVYEIVADWWSVFGVKRKQFVESVTQRYAYHVAVDQLQEQGFSLVKETKQKGEIHLLLRRSG